MCKFYFAIKHFLLTRILIGLSLKKQAMVLDIGSGDKPFWRANVFVDDMDVSDYERAGKNGLIKYGFFVDANAESLPFEDETFDFVYCSHVLEHVANPEMVLKEMQRVVKKDGGGYIECPNAIVEAILPFPGHRWLIFENEAKGLTFIRQSKCQHFASIGNKQFSQKLFRKLNWNGYDLFIKHKWKKSDKFSFEVF